MNRKSLAALYLITGSLLLGCEKPAVDNARQTVPPTVSQSSSTAQVTVPKGDPSVPSADAALNKPKTGTDATSDTELTRAERDKQMPLPGQANDHSTPDFAKKGDDTSPAKSAK
jgi:hypothetical protein